MNVRCRVVCLAVVCLGVIPFVAGCRGQAPGAPRASTPSPPARTASRWATNKLAYPADTLASTFKDVGERSFPHHDIRLPYAGAQFLDASSRYALLTDSRSQRLRVVDLRRGRTHLLLPSPLTLRQAPSAMWVRARAALHSEFGARFAPTLISSVRTSGRQIVWEEALCVTAGGFAFVGQALYSAHLTPRMELGPATLIALDQPRSVRAERSVLDWPRGDFILSYALQQEKLLVIRGVGRGERAEIVDLTNGRRVVLLDFQGGAEPSVAGVLADRRVVIRRSATGGRVRLTAYDLADDGLPCAVADLSPSNLREAESGGFALAPDGRLAWAEWYSLAGGADEAEAVFLLSPDGTIECLAAVGGEPVFFGATVLWVGSTDGRYWLGGARLDERERFTVAGADRLRGGSVAGDEHVAVVLLEPNDRRSSTLRVFDVQ